MLRTTAHALCYILNIPSVFIQIFTVLHVLPDAIREKTSWGKFLQFCTWCHRQIPLHRFSASQIWNNNLLNTCTLLQRCSCIWHPQWIVPTKIENLQWAKDCTRVLQQNTECSSIKSENTDILTKNVCSGYVEWSDAIVCELSTSSHEITKPRQRTCKGTIHQGTAIWRTWGSPLTAN